MVRHLRFLRCLSVHRVLSRLSIEWVLPNDIHKVTCQSKVLPKGLTILTSFSNFCAASSVLGKFSITTLVLSSLFAFSTSVSISLFRFCFFASSFMRLKRFAALFNCVDFPDDGPPLARGDHFSPVSESNEAG